MANMNIVSLFPTPVGQFNIGRNLTKKELGFMLDQEKRTNVGNTTSVNRYILKDKKLTDLNTFIETSVLAFFNEIVQPEHDVNLRVTQSWLNYTEPGQFHHRHRHPNSVLSAVFYVDADPEVDKIYFYEHTPYKQIQFKIKNWNIFNSNSWWLPVSSGDLFIFPSNFEHSVETKSGSNTRVSLALNTFPVGYVGDDDTLTGLRL